MAPTITQVTYEITEAWLVQAIVYSEVLDRAIRLSKAGGVKTAAGKAASRMRSDSPTHGRRKCFSRCRFCSRLDKMILLFGEPPGGSGNRPIQAVPCRAASKGLQGENSMKWITREKAKVDRVACPWLIKNFIDPQAEFVFLPANTDWSVVRDGIVYDVPDCELGHHGEDVSFNSILKKYCLTDQALQLLGEIVRAADSHPSQPHPAGEGLRWVAHGFSTLGFTDHQILEREFIVYDALYAECRRRTHSGASFG
jgi:hypothetical protein